MHKHVSWELVYHQQGSGKTSLPDGSTFKYEPQSMVLYGTQISHDQISYKGSTNHCIHMQLPDELAMQLPPCLVSPPLHDNDLISNCISLCHTRLPKSNIAQQALDHQASFVLLRFLQAAQTGSSPRNKSIENHARLAHQYILENFRHIQSVQDIATHLKVGYDPLRHQFTNRYGMSLNRCLIQSRIQRSEQLLEHATLTHVQIAELVGFANERYFNTSFKKTVGITPGQYRKQHQKQ